MHFKLYLLINLSSPHFQCYIIGRVINEVCQYFFDGDSYFVVFYTYKKQYMIFFPKFIWFSFVDFHFKKIWRRGGPKYLLLKNMDLLYAKEAQKNRNSNHVIEPRNEQKTAHIWLFGSAY